MADVAGFSVAGAKLAYAGTDLDRAAAFRSDAHWVASQLARADTRVIPLWRDLCMVSASGTPVILSGAAAVQDAEQVVLLGLDGPTAVFAADMSALPEPEALQVCGAARTADLRTLVGTLPSAEAAALAYGRGMLHWNRNQRYCGSCGGGTISQHGGHVRLCQRDGCSRELFPRIEPAVVVLVEAPGPVARCLLARHRGAGDDSFSLLAGFVEVGESLEGAVRREVTEEAGVAVGEVVYQASQGWPFPAGLMVGFRARATSDTTHVDGQELVEARWFTLSEVAARAARGAGLGPVDSIGRTLLRDWLDERR